MLPQGRSPVHVHEPQLHIQRPTAHISLSFLLLWLGLTPQGLFYYWFLKQVGRSKGRVTEVDQGRVRIGVTGVAGRGVVEVYWQVLVDQGIVRGWLIVIHY